MKTLAALVEDYLASRRDRGVSRLQLNSVACCLRGWAHWLEQSAQITSPTGLTPQAITRWMQFLSVRRHRFTGLPLRPHTIYYYLNRVSIFCSQLEQAGYIPSQVTAAFPLLRRQKHLPRSTPSHAEIRRFLRSMPSDTPRGYMMRAMAELLYTSALRPAEALALNVADVDLANGLAKVMGKGRKERVVPIGRTARQILENYINGVRPKFLRRASEPALWLNLEGGRLGYNGLMIGVHRNFPVRGGMRITSYSLRRGCATELIRAGASIWAVKELLGHDRLETLEHYVNLTIEDLKKTHARCHPRERASAGTGFSADEKTS